MNACLSGIMSCARNAKEENLPGSMIGTGKAAPWVLAFAVGHHLHLRSVLYRCSLFQVCHTGSVESGCPGPSPMSFLTLGLAVGVKEQRVRRKTWCPTSDPVLCPLH